MTGDNGRQNRPVLAALDADKNGDGSLTPDELIPDKVASQTAKILSGLDTNGDDAISPADRAGAQAGTR